MTNLATYPQKHEQLISDLAVSSWETGISKKYLTGDDVLSLLNYERYFKLSKEPVPQNRDDAFLKLEDETIIVRNSSGKWDITNLGAVLFAHDIKNFDHTLQRKAIRLIVYDGKNKSASVTNRFDGNKGYAVDFENMIKTLNLLIPDNEYIENGRRHSVPMLPAIAVRELVANALIHQDFTVRGAGPLIELFENRLEISNPGNSLIETERMIDMLPRSRNEKLAALMRRLEFCEESGSGLDRAIVAIELSQSPPPDFRNSVQAMQVLLHGPRSYAHMAPDERDRACYQHAVIKYLDGKRLKNKTLRERFGIASQNTAQVSAVIKNALEKNLIKPADPAYPRSGYIPFWG